MNSVSVVQLPRVQTFFFFTYITLFQINLQGPLTMRVSYNDYKLYLSILESVSKQLNKAIKSEVSSNATEEIPDHDFDGKTKMNIEYHFI